MATQRKSGKAGPDQAGLGAISGISMEIQMYRLRGLGMASAQCPLGESAVTCHGEANHRTAHRAKSASSDRSGFFRFEVFEAGAGASVGGEGRSGTVSAALARSSRNLSNSAIQTKLRDRLGEGCVAGAPYPGFQLQPVSYWPGYPLGGGTCAGDGREWRREGSWQENNPARSRLIPGPPGLGISLREVTVPDSPQAELVKAGLGDVSREDPVYCCGPHDGKRV